MTDLDQRVLGHVETSTETDSTSSWLATVDRPEDVRMMTPSALASLAAEIRQFLIDQVCSSGGHLGPNLGAVELTIALHRVFDSPYDPIIFDTGHQSYVHKLITGRRASFSSLRKRDGMSGYPSQAESEHDLVENSHASTALSYADGLAKAFELCGKEDRTVVAVVGDGALTGGMCWEALNNIGASHLPIVVVLNDNGRSYEATAGALAAHLTDLRGGELYAESTTLFDHLGLLYLGPVDGHDVVALERALVAAKMLRRPVVVHAVTVKGRGYQLAERHEADRMHAVGMIDPSTGKELRASAPSWTSVFGHKIAEIGRRRPDVVAITAAMKHPVGLGEFAAEFPDRVFDVGIAEQHAVTSAAGLAMGGMHPVVAIYATFLNRAFDQVLMDVALHRLPVTFVLDRAGITGPDGPSHHGMWDLSLLSMVPRMRIASPRDATRLRELLDEAVLVDDGPTALRFPKASVGPDIPALARVGCADVLFEGGRDVLLVAVGTTAPMCVEAAQRLRAFGVQVTVVDPRWVIPVDPRLVELVREFRLAYVVEDGVRDGGVSSAIAQACFDDGVSPAVRSVSLPRRFLPHGTPADVAADCGLRADDIIARVLVHRERLS